MREPKKQTFQRTVYEVEGHCALLTSRDTRDKIHQVNDAKENRIR